MSLVAAAGDCVPCATAFAARMKAATHPEADRNARTMPTTATIEPTLALFCSKHGARAGSRTQLVRDPGTHEGSSVGQA